MNIARAGGSDQIIFYQALQWTLLEGADCLEMAGTIFTMQVIQASLNEMVLLLTILCTPLSFVL